MTIMPFMGLVLVISSVMCFLMNSWLSIWIMLEINTLAFCCTLKSFSMKSKMSTESSMKYFIIQSVASSLLIFSSSVASLSKNFMMILFATSVFSLLIKMASSPFHQWFINITKKMSWKNASALLTWQKIAPVFLLIYQIKNIILPFLILSALVGSTSQMNKIYLMEIMAFSSIFNLSWMVLAVMVNTKMLILFSMIYWMSVILVVKSIESAKMKKVNSESIEKTKKWLYFIIIVNLAGIPPMAGFMAKWMVFSESLLMKMHLIITLLLMSSSVNLFIYMRMTNFILTKNSNKNQKSNSQLSKFLMLIMILVNLFPLVLLFS